LWVVFEAMGITKTIAKESRVVVASVGRHILKPAHRVMAVLANVKLVLIVRPPSTRADNVPVRPPVILRI
jgi:hypothetical protein